MLQGSLRLSVKEKYLPPTSNVNRIFQGLSEKEKVPVVEKYFRLELSTGHMTDVPGIFLV
jgi:hypothetical protein